MNNSGNGSRQSQSLSEKSEMDGGEEFWLCPKGSSVTLTGSAVGAT
jgi:hypothetical protein